MKTQEQFERFGKIMWLWSNSDLHKTWPIHLQSRFVLPAVMLNQYHMIEKDSFPVAYCSWALISSDVESRLILDPNALNPDDWRSGDRLWFIDFVSPFSTRFTWKLRSGLAELFPKSVARAIRVKKDRDKAQILSFKGTELDKQEGRATKRKYFDEMHQALLSHKGIGKDFQLRVS